MCHWHNWVVSNLRDNSQADGYVFWCIMYVFVSVLKIEIWKSYKWAFLLRCKYIFSFLDAWFAAGQKWHIFSVFKIFYWSNKSHKAQICFLRAFTFIVVYHPFENQSNLRQFELSNLARSLADYEESYDVCLQYYLAI